MPIVPVEIPGASYPIVVERQLLDGVGRHVRRLSKSDKVCIVTDSNVAPLYLAQVQRSLTQQGFSTIAHTVPAGEKFKTLDSISAIYNTFLPARIDRNTPVLALGGGVIGDMAGFAAATILRGVPFIQIPTTLLAMVDASVGGKTGIDHAVGKNLIGAFHQPKAVLIDPQVLTTLPPRQLRSGLAECIKHDIIRDGENFPGLQTQLPKILQLDIPALTDLIAHNVRIKAQVVAADPFEKGERAHLNFGHTFGHAIEIVSAFSYAHGEAVALGMSAAAFLAMRLAMIDPHAYEQTIRTIAAAGLPTSGLTLNVDDIVHAMQFDKKAASGKLRFILPDRIGHVVMIDDIADTLIREALESLRH